jgi:hypothetical protein
MLNESDDKKTHDEHIEYILENDENVNDTGFNINDFMNDFNSINVVDDASTYELDEMYSSVTDYDENYTLKQLLQICEFYGFTKGAKSKKLDVIGAIVMFENNTENGAIVYRRRQLWHYINELKRDKFMKRFVIW